MADDLLKALRAHVGGMSRTDIRNLFGRNKSALEINKALNLLRSYGVAWRGTVEETGGRPEERWFATKLATTETIKTP